MDYLASSTSDPFGGIVRRYPSANLQMSCIKPVSDVVLNDGSALNHRTWPSGQRVLGSLVVAGAKLDDMHALEAVPFVQLSKVRRRMAAKCRE